MPRFIGNSIIGSVVGGTGGSVSSEVDWTPITIVDQALGAISDPGGLTDTGTGFSGGTFTVETNPAHATTVVGYRNAMARWTVNLLGLFPDFDPSKDLIQLRIRNITGFSTGGTDGYLVYAAILNYDTSDIANCDGACVSLRRLNATPTIQAQGISRTAAITTTNYAAAKDQLLGTFGWAYNGTNFNPWAVSAAQTAASTTYEVSITTTGGGPLHSTIADWAIHIGVGHAATTTADLSFTWSVDARILKATEP